MGHRGQSLVRKGRGAAVQCGESGAEDLGQYRFDIERGTRTSSSCLR